MNALEEANNIIHGDRNKDYGHPLDNHNTTAAMWSAYLSRKYRGTVLLDACDVCWMNVLQKVSREANVHKHDNVVDVAGYAGNVEMVLNEQEKRGAA